MRCVTHAVVLLMLGLSAGCAHYEYDIVAPPELAGHIGERADTVLARDHLLFRLRSYDNYLVIRIQNPGNEPVRLIGGQSVVVDPYGQSHALADRLIAPQSWIKLVFPPPPPPDVYGPGPVIGLGFGFGGPGWYSGFSAPIVASPPYYPEYPYPVWTWEGQTDVRLTLALQTGSEPVVRENFVFHRQRM